MAKTKPIITTDFNILETDVEAVTDNLNASEQQPGDAWHNPGNDKKKNIRVNFMVDQDTKTQLEAMARYHGMTISAYLNELIKRDIEACTK